VSVPDLPKHLRPRWRYLAVGLETWPGATIDRRSVQASVWSAARSLYGDVGAADIDLTVVRFEGGDGSWDAIVRTHRGEVERARAVLASLGAIDGADVGVVVRGTSGTVRACEEKYIGGRPEASDQSDVAFGNATRRAVQRGERVDVHVESAFVAATTLDLQ
jgi:ribonuclease P/MRP protein subunit POP5